MILIAPQIYLERGRHRPWRSLARCLPCADHLLLEGTEQEEVEQVSDPWPTVGAVQTTEAFLGNSATVGSSTRSVLLSNPTVSSVNP